MAHTAHAAHTVRYDVTLKGGTEVVIFGLDAFHTAQAARTIARVRAITPLYPRG